MNKQRLVYKFLLHQLFSRHTKGFGVHSPYMFSFVRYVLCEKHPFYVFNEIENVRKNLMNSQSEIFVEDFGTGSNSTRKVSQIAKKSLMPPKYAQLMFRLVNYSKPEIIVELGTSLGITTSYMSSVSANAKCVSFEGSEQVANIAKANFKELGLNNVDLIVGDINITLKQQIEKLQQIDFVVIDANHTSKSVLTYFEFLLEKTTDKTIMVFDDIHWSQDMEMAWGIIKNNKKVYSTIDLFRCGIVFFNSDLNKKHYKIRY